MEKLELNYLALMLRKKIAVNILRKIPKQIREMSSKIYQLHKMCYQKPSILRSEIQNRIRILKKHITVKSIHSSLHTESETKTDNLLKYNIRQRRLHVRPHVEYLI